MCEDGMKCDSRTPLSHDVHVTSRCDDETARSMCRAHWLCNLRVLVFVSFLLDVVHAVDTVFVAIFCSWRCTLYTPRR